MEKELSIKDGNFSIEKFEKKIDVFPEQAKRIIVHNQKTLTVANEFLLDIKRMRKEINDTFDPIIDKAHKAHKEAIAKKKKYEAPLIEAEKAVKLQIGSYVSEQERLKREAEEKARKEEEERLRIEEEKIKEAKSLMAAGEEETAEKVLDEIPLQKIQDLPAIPGLTDTSVKMIWKWALDDINLVPREYLMPDSSKITAVVRAGKGKIRIPGIRIYPERSVAATLK